MLTYRQFLARLAETPRMWRTVDPYYAGCPGADLIRASPAWNVCCPLDAVIPDCGETGFRDAPAWWRAVRAAADGHQDPAARVRWKFGEIPPEQMEHLRAVRADLLEACGLTGEIGADE